MNFARVLRVLLLVALPLYGIFYIRTACPLSQGVPETAMSDPLCVYTHRVFEVVGPYAEVAKDAYESSPLKPRVDFVVDQSRVIVEPYFKRWTEWLNSLRDQAFQRTNITQEELLANLDSGSKLLGEHLTTVINFINHHMAVTVYPFFLETSKVVIQYCKFVCVKAKMLVYIQWKVYVEPLLTVGKYYFFKSEVGKYCVKITQTDEFKLVQYYVADIKRRVVAVFRFIQEKWMEFKEANHAMAMSRSFKAMEEKKNFLLQEINKFIDGSFNKGDGLEEETETIRSTITITSTSLRASPTVAAVKSSEKYQLLLDKTLEEARVDFETQVSNLSHKFAEGLHATFVDKLKSLGASVTVDYGTLHELLQRINTHLAPEMEGHVSRQEFRDALEEKRSSIGEKAEAIAADIEKTKAEFVSKVADIRTSILEALEEFSDSSLNAYSAEIVNNDSDWSEWKKFKALKSQLITFRDELINYDIDSVDREFANSINGIKTQVNILLNEGGSYLAILRAKANLEFQTRESSSRSASAAEAEAAAAQVETQAETQVQTHTVLKIIPLEETHVTETRTVLEVIPLETIQPEQGKIEELLDDTLKAGAMEAAYEAADLVEPVVEDVLHAANEMVAEALNL